ncbi:MAG: class I SAM-dependent methyltransferase [Sulfurimonas sp.]|nr:class I SAM-dependent methyltransferase [Sulfurimonas sp.]MDQ7059863.1 class I SAM-dependent methyltransferase [Sulfurimonas sp.]
MHDKLVKSIHGYYSIKDMPSEETLKKHYQDKYFQDNKSVYTHSYSKAELSYLQTKAKVSEYIFSNTFHEKKLLDVGAGEGFFANYFLNKQWDITTLDYSSYAIKNHNPELEKTLVQGDIFNSLDNLIHQKEYYTLINLSNVLEHVINPIQLLTQLKILLSKGSLLRISVPNDYSDFQKLLLEQGKTSNTWFCPPEHLHYFTFNSLIKLLESLDYEIVISMGEFPIEVFLSNESSNYAKNQQNGKAAHQSRIEIDNFILGQGLEKYINYYKASADIGLSRQVVIFAKIKN